jgi:hypothetical protein
MRKYIITIICIFSVYYVFPQSAKINTYLKYIAEGKVEIVKNKLPDLIADYGDEPGVLLLQGVVLNNAQNAVPYYKKIIDNYPNSEFAPNALWRLIQYYAIVGDTTTAKMQLARFREKYPTSPFLSAATDIVRVSISDIKYKNREKYHNEIVEEDTKIEKETIEIAKVSDNPPSVIDKVKYGLQVGIYSTKEAAESEKARFIKTARLRTEVLEKLVSGERKYAVIIGNYDSEDEALRAKAIVEKQCKCNPLIYKK